MNWTDSIRNSKATANGVTFRAFNNALVVSDEHSFEKRFAAPSRAAAKAHAETIAAGAL